MLIDKISFSKIKLQYEILKMKSAYIEAERAIIGDPSLTGFKEQKEMTPQDFWDLTNIKPSYVTDAISTERALIKAQMHELEETGRRLQDEEKYELLAEAKEIWEKLKQKLNSLK